MSSSKASELNEFQGKLRAMFETHRGEIERAVLARVRSNKLDLPMTPAAQEGMRALATDSTAELIESFSVDFDWTPTLPHSTAAYVKYLAREDVPLEMVMRLCTLIGGVFLESILAKLGDDEAKLALKYIAAWGSRNLDRLLNAYTAEFNEELERLDGSPAGELRGRIGRLLRGGIEDAGATDYRMDACHTGLIVVGKNGDLICRHMAESIGCDLLVVPDAENTFWVWFGARRRLEFAELERSATAGARALAISVGEPREGGDGWRLTHHEAQAALPVARLEGPGLIRYSNVTLLASALSDEAAGRSLMDRYLMPLDGHRDGEDLRQTLRAYFELNCNAVSTASSLGVNRHTVQRRLKRVEEAIGEPPAARQAEFGVALRLEELTARTRAAVGS